MTQLKDLFETMAAEVRTYNVAAPVMQAARRRRAARMAAPLLAAVTVAGLVVMVGYSPWRGAGDVVDAAGHAGIQTLPWLPPTVTSPEQEPAPLPRDRAVGRGALLYARCALPCPARLVTESGEQFRLAAPSGEPVVRPVPSLSPDGTWLSYPDAEGRYVLRELTSVRTLPIGSRRPLGWSTDGKLVVLGEPDTQHAGSAVDVLSLADGTVRTVPLPAPGLDGLTGLTAEGELLFAATRDEESGAIETASVRIDGATTIASLSARDAMAGGEQLSGDLLLDPFAPAIIMQVMAKDGNVWAPADLLRVDLGDKKVTRIRLPKPGSVDSQPHADADTEYGPQGGDHRQLTNVLPEGVVLLYWDGPAPRAVELLNPVSGVRTVITRFSGTIDWVRVRGDLDTR